MLIIEVTIPLNHLHEGKLVKVLQGAQVEQIHRILLQVVRALVKHPELAIVEVLQTDSGHCFTVQVAHSDVYSLIGPAGRTVQSLRTILHGLGTKNGSQLELVVRALEDRPGQHSTRDSDLLG